ncbi:signal peptidase I [Virgibacillus halodenitrificans]|uniref:signal peptidase I SipW n=1 Tax=Virgibacillus halodenitrificans TaxID=1482 RepID=UPI0013717226|nr:signal peptidase I [Virgibacillus halodenitrificans]MYL45211.1 signal peptidase I [Virgibacillus halodenitrificans]
MSRQTKKKIGRWLNSLSTGILFAVLIAFMLVVISAKASGGEPQVFGYQFKTVLSGSMEPDIKTGSLIAVESIKDANGLTKGDVITFKKDENMLVTHRIIEVVKNESGVSYRTKGDNNDGPDLKPVPSENVVATYTGFTIPYVGYFINFAQSKNGALLLLIPGFLLLCYSGITIWGALKEIDSKSSNKMEA